MKEKFRLADAGNVLPPIYYLLVENGFEVSLSGERWTAENSEVILSSEDLVALTGMVYLYQNKGENWRVTDDQIDSFVQKYS